MLVKGFNNDMLFIARQSRGLSQEEATERTGLLSQPTYSRLEAGLRAPTEDEVEALARGVDVRRNFLFHPFRRRPMPAIFHRKRQKLTNRDWERVFAQAEVRRICIALLSERVTITNKLPPAPQFEVSAEGTPSDAAASVRQMWMLPRGPIPDLTRIMEAAGIIVVAFDFGTDLVDGFSERVQDGLPPLVFVNKRLSRDRLRFTLAHELGHIVMHRLAEPKMEEEANQFASDLLMPANDIALDFFDNTPDHYLSLKGKWRASVAAIARKGHDIGKLSAQEFKDFNIGLRQLGWQKIEPMPLPDNIENPRTLSSLLSAHTSQLGFSSEELAQMFGLPINEVESAFSLVTAKSPLRLVISN